MTAPIPFDKHRFRAAAPHYLAGRPAYAPRLIGRVARLCELLPWHRVIDIGCGPGQLALAFAPLVREVVGVDPEPAMLRAAAAAAEDARAVNIDWFEGSSYDLGAAFGRFRLAVIGRAFHWMDRPDTLRRLDGMIEPDGAVALFADTHPDVPDNAWRADWRAVIERHAGISEARLHRQAGGWVRHEALLLDSAFSEVEQITVIERREVSVAQLVARALSHSPVARSGVDAEVVGRDIAAALAAHAPEGTLREVVATSALIARRPGSAA
jgi:SAM-dependent methyltransferase